MGLVEIVNTDSPKICALCKCLKPESEFHKNSRSKDGLTSYCKECNKKKAAYLKTDKGRKSHQRAMNKQISKGYYRYGKGAIPILRQAAAKRNISFSLQAKELEEWWHQHPDNCYYCGLSLLEYLRLRDLIIGYKGNNEEIIKFKRFYRSPKHASIKWMTIDRRNNSKGYEFSNLVKACWICNSLKNDFFTEEEMKFLSPKVIQRLKVSLNSDKM